MSTARPILMSAPMVRDFANPDWSYFLGVVHGDGHVAKRSISISVSYKEPEYLEALMSLVGCLGYGHKLYRPRSAYRLDIHSSALASELRATKSLGVWSIPDTIQIGPYLAGIIDTDGHLTKAPQRQVVITLKRSGNLRRLCDRLARQGLRCNPVKEKTSTFKGKPYEIEEARWAGADQIEWIAQNCRLRHPRKARRLVAMLAEVEAYRSKVPLWQLVADWISQEPHDLDQIMDRFGLTKRQADSILGNIKLNCDVEVIPPPRALTKYRVRGPQ